MKPLFTSAFFLFFHTFISGQDTLYIKVPQSPNIVNTPITYTTSAGGPTLSNFFKPTLDTLIFSIESGAKNELKIKIGNSGCELTIPEDKGPDLKSPYMFLLEKTGGIEYKVSGLQPGLTTSAECNELVHASLDKIKVAYQGQDYDIKEEQNKDNTSPVLPNAIKFVSPKMWELLNTKPDRYLITNLEAVTSGYYLIYNLSERDFQLYKPHRQKGDPWESTRFPKVGEAMNVVVENYNPYRDSLKLTESFKDHFTNAEESFKNIILGASGSADTKSDGNAGTSETTGSRGRPEVDERQDQVKNLISTFHMEMVSLYSSLHSRDALNFRSLNEFIELLKSNIVANFEIPEANASLIEAAGNKLIESTMSGDNNKTLRAYYTNLLAAGIKKLEQIQDFHPIYHEKILIKDHDLTQLNFNTKHGSKWNAKTDSYDYHNRWGWGFGYSVGFMYSNLRDYHYDLKRVKRFTEKSVMDGTNMTVRDTIYKDSIFQINNGDFNIGVLALGHIYTRIPPFGNLAISTGLGINGQLDNHYFLGFSAMIGRKRQFVLSGGWVFAKVKRLDAKYTVGELLDVMNSQSNSVSNSREVWERGTFFAITYQL